MAAHIAKNLVALVVALTLPGQLEAQSYTSGQAAYDLGDYQTAIGIWQPLANEGDAESQYALGRMFAKGIGVSRDDVEAMRWFRLSAEQGHVDALFAMGVGYHSGLGVTRDDAECAKWLRLAAEKGHAKASSVLGFLYLTGQGVPKDSSQALPWIRLAAVNGESLAQYNLGLMYAGGDGVPKDHVLAYIWISISADNGQADTDGDLKQLEQHLSITERIEARARAIVCRTSGYSHCD